MYLKILQNITSINQSLQHSHESLSKLTVRSLFLKILIDDDKITLLDTLFQASTALLLKKYLRTSL